MSFLTELLSSQHRKADFTCGKELLDIYFREQAKQDVKRMLSACFVLPDKDGKTVAGYYTLSNSTIPLELVPEKYRKKLPKSYKSIPATLLGRLAVDKNFQGKGLGKLLLIDALKRSYEISSKIGSFAVVVDPIDEEAEAFYESFGFTKLPDSGKQFIAMNTIKQLFDR